MRYKTFATTNVAPTKESGHLYDVLLPIWFPLLNFNTVQK